MTFKISLIVAPDPGPKSAAAAALYQYNIEQTGIDDRSAVAAVAADTGTGEVVGGLWGRTELGLLFLEMFFLPAPLRGDGTGSRLLTLVEAEAVRRGCRHAVVESSTFQAPGFYERHGYQEFGRVPFGIEKQARVFLRKELG